jgi:hypothetical protein
MPKIEVRNVRVLNSASEETLCFTATVVVDGLVAGAVSNDGRGGANRYEPHTLERVLTAYAATLPPLSYGDNTPKTLPHNADSAIGEVVDEFLSRKELERTLKNYVVFLSNTNALKKSRKLAKGADSKVAAQVWVGRPEVNAVLNLLPVEEALKIWRGTYAGIPGVGL